MDMNVSYNKNQTILFYILQKLNGEIGRTQLIKLCYLSDIAARQWFGRPITTYEYFLDEHGPFDSVFFKDKEQLEYTNKIQEKRYGLGYQYDIVDDLDNMQLDMNEKILLDYIIDQYGKLQLSILLDEVVYKTEPLKTAKENNMIGQILDLSIHDNAIKNKGYDFETHYASLKEIAEGKTIEL